MRTSCKSKNSLTKIDEMVGLDSVFQVLEYDELRGGKSIDTAFSLSIMKDAHIRLRQVRIFIKDAAIRIESGALQFMKGDITIDSKLGGILGMGKKILSKTLTNETVFKPLYYGTGEIFLEPSFGHYSLIELEDEDIIVDDGLFYACEEGVQVGVAAQKTLSSAFFGKEGLFQTKLSGSGIAVLELPVPESEVIKVKLINETLKVDGNFAILRSGRIEFSVEKSAKTLLGSGTSGEGLLNVFRGTGEVWIIPTSHIYDEIKNMNIRELTNPKGEMNTQQGNES